ncbi:MAG: hypothetical protein CVT88_01475 [Candidatus Altiarchaeales archaeon HGW-Altiarchaeales-1]|nr:MAG: hypothetical protein CVT88_01475 [Candidatus Altiarchaeales archaeon HGW-Altiarchaeales-1]
MGEKLVLDENIFYKAININENKHNECYKLVEIIYETKHKLVCDQNLKKRYGERIENISRKDTDEKAMDNIQMMLRTSGKEGYVIMINEGYKRRLEKMHKELLKQMKGSFDAYFKQNAKSNKEDLEIAKIVAISMAYALITEDSEFYKWIKDFLNSYFDNYEKLEKINTLKSDKALEDKKINPKNQNLN